LFTIFFVKETKGKTEEECLELYLPEDLKHKSRQVEYKEQVDETK